jgi:hypothetical protein
MLSITACNESEAIVVGRDERVTETEIEPERSEKTTDNEKINTDDSDEEITINKKDETVEPTTTLSTTTPPETEAEETTFSIQVLPMSQAQNFPDTAFGFYHNNEGYVIDTISGKILCRMSNDFYEVRDITRYVGMEDGFFKAVFRNGDNVYIDANTNMIEAPADAEVDPEIVNGLKIQRKDDFYGVSDVSGIQDKTVVDYMYYSIEGNADYSMFIVSINGAFGVVNNKNEVIVPPRKGSRDYHYYYDRDFVCFYDDMVILWTEDDTTAKIYDSTGALLTSFTGTFDYIGHGRFLVYQEIDDDNIITKLIDKNGNVIKEDFGLGEDFINMQKYGAVNELDIASQNVPDGKNFVLVTAEYKVTYGYRNTLNIMDEDGNILMPWEKDEKGSPSWVVSDNYFAYSNLTENKETGKWTRNFYVFDYTGTLKHTFNNVIFEWAGENIFIGEDETDDMYKLYNSDFEPIHSMTAYKTAGNNVIVTDETGVFYGLYIGDELVHPCTYTSAEFIKDIDGKISLVKLNKGSEETYVTAATGAVVYFPYNT